MSALAIAVGVLGALLVGAVAWVFWSFGLVGDITDGDW